MGLFRGIGRAVKPLVNMPYWLGWTRIKEAGKEVTGMGKELFVAEKAKHKETFEQAVRRLNLTEKDIQRKKRSFLTLAIFYLILGGLFIVYASFLFFSLELFAAGVVGLVLAGVAFTFFYREYFRFYQMKKRKLGCTFQEILHDPFGRLGG